LRADAVASTASRPAFRDDREPPLWGRDGALVELILAGAKAEYFFDQGWTLISPSRVLICQTGGLPAKATAVLRAQLKMSQYDQASRQSERPPTNLSYGSVHALNSEHAMITS
jgi:hypothetical protein